MKEAIIAVVAVIALAFSALVFIGQLPKNEAPDAPDFKGQDHSFHEYFQAGVTVGGKVIATSSQGAVTYPASAFIDTTLIQHTAPGALTATLPASSTLSGTFVPKAGDIRTIFLTPITTGITLAAGTGTDLNSASSTKSCPASAVCRLDFVRKSNTDIEVLLTSGGL